jgi:WXG100 family type VII secretion target
MATAAGQVESAVGQIRGLQSQLTGYQESLAGTWQGDASTAFSNAYLTFSSDFTKIIQALEGIHDRLVTTQAKYSATEEQNTAAVTRVGGLLNK